jgi:hypothetical protein
MIGGDFNSFIKLLLSGEGGVEGCTGSEHGAGDVEEGVADLAEGSAVTVTTASQSPL